MAFPRLSPTSYVVLGTIALRGPSTPYDLKRAVGHSIGYFWPFPHAQLYSEPKRLTAAGLLDVTREDGGRRRQVYHLTDAGLGALRAWLAEPTNEQMQVRDIAEMKLFFSELARPEDVRALAGQQVEQHRRRIAVYEAMMERFGPRPELAPRLISLRLGLRIEYAALEFWTGFREETALADGTQGNAAREDATAENWLPSLPKFSVITDPVPDRMCDDSCVVPRYYGGMCQGTEWRRDEGSGPPVANGPDRVDRGRRHARRHGDELR